MEKVGIRELKNKLSSYINSVKEGRSFIITDRGSEVAIIEPFNIDSKKELLLIIKENNAAWSGYKPIFPIKGVNIKSKKTASDFVIEERK